MDFLYVKVSKYSCYEYCEDRTRQLLQAQLQTCILNKFCQIMPAHTQHFTLQDLLSLLQLETTSEIEGED